VIGHAARIAEMKITSIGKPEGRDRCVDTKIILKCTLRVLGVFCGVDSSGSSYGSMIGFCEHGNELSGFIKDWKLLGQVSDSELVRPVSYGVRGCEINVILLNS
jgi:hypothetical protein